MLNCTTFLDVNQQCAMHQALVMPSRGCSYTYRELLETVCRVGNGLREMGVAKGDRVCIYLDSSPEYLVSYLALWRIGAVAVPTNLVYREAELLYALTNSEASAVITDKRGITVVEAIRTQASSLRLIVVAGERGAKTVGWEALLGHSPDLAAVPCAFDDLCQIQYTSGTTGRPKGAMLSHGNWMAAMDAEREVLCVTGSDRYLGIYPMGHVGVSWGIAHLRAGATWVAMERFDLARYLSCAEAYHATVVAAMPPVIHSLVHSPPGTEDRLSDARVMISGGGPLHSGIWKKFDERFKIPIVNAYGLSETIVVGTGTATRIHQDPGEGEFSSVGTPVGFSEVEIVDEDDPATVRLPGETGEIALRGPAVSQGYWRMPAETAEVFLPGGWFLTGDIGYQDDKGMLYITDRKKDMIIMSGWKIFPTEVEEVLLRHPGIGDVALFGCYDEHRGEVPVAAVVPGEGADVTGEEIIAFAKEHLAGYKVPRTVILVETLPRVNAWKLLRRELRERYCRGSNKGRGA